MSLSLEFTIDQPTITFDGAASQPSLDIDVTQATILFDGVGGVAGAGAAHSSTHSDGDSDEVTASDLGSGAATSGQVLTADGAGGNSYATPVAAASGRTLYAEDPVTGDIGPGFWTEGAIVLSEMRASIVGGASPSVTWSIRYAADRSAAGTEVVTGGTVSTDQTTGDVVTVFNNGTIAAGSFVWLELTSVSSGADAPESFDATLTV